MSETEWSDIPEMEGRVTAAKLGESAGVAVIRWGDKYRVIRVSYNSGLVHRVRPGLPPRARSICHVFGIENEFLLAEKVCPDVVTVLVGGREFECETWALRNECTIPPNGPRACSTPDLCGDVGMNSVWKTGFTWKALGVDSPLEGIKYLRKNAKRVRILSYRRHDGAYAYRVVYWHSPSVGDRVRIQGLSATGILKSCENEMCGVLIKGMVLRVHRTCLVRT